MLPLPASAHKDAALTNLSIGYRNQTYIADRVFPNVPVMKQSDYFYKFLKGAWFRNEAAVRGPGSAANRGGYPLTSDTYSCREYAFDHPVPIELLANADAAIKPMETGVRYCIDKIMLAKEKVVSDLCVTAANWTTTDDVAAGWLYTGTSTFIADILGGKETIRKLIGVYPNVLVMDAKTFKNAKLDSTVLERIKYTGTQGAPADITARTLAQLFELDEVLIGGAIYSSAKEAKAGTDFTAVDLWETNATKGAALLFYRPPAPALWEPSAGYIFNWKGSAEAPLEMAAGDVYRSVYRWWEDAIKSWVLQGSEYFDAKVTCADAGLLFYDTLVT